MYSDVLRLLRKPTTKAETPPWFMQSVNHGCTAFKNACLCLSFLVAKAASMPWMCSYFYSHWSWTYKWVDRRWSLGNSWYYLEVRRRLAMAVHIENAEFPQSCFELRWMPSVSVYQLTPALPRVWVRWRSDKVEWVASGRQILCDSYGNNKKMKLLEPSLLSDQKSHRHLATGLTCQ